MYEAIHAFLERRGPLDRHHCARGVVIQGPVGGLVIAACEPNPAAMGGAARNDWALCLRGSRRAEVDYRVEAGVARLRVGNDGAPSAAGASGGTGLDMLAERLAAAGGTLTREHQGDRFVLAASLPLDAGGEAG